MNTLSQNSRVAIIQAGLEWNKTDIELEAGCTYDFSVVGTWMDASIECSADGYPPPELKLWQKMILACFSPLRRVRSEKWFALIGVIDQDMSTAFLIGQEAKGIKVAHSGKLTCFANDVPFKYGNNSGAVTLTVTVTTPTQQAIP